MLIKKIMAAIAVMLSMSLSARVGCLHNSYDDPTRRFDPKTYHLVECNCECEKKYAMAPDGTCTKCKHRRDFMYLQDVARASSKSININRLKGYQNRNQAQLSQF